MILTTTSEFATVRGPLGSFRVSDGDIEARDFPSLEERLSPVLPASLLLDEAIESEVPMDLADVVARPAGKHYRQS